MKSSILALCMLSIACYCSASNERVTRVKRQNPGDALIDAVFQVPIQTLSAVGTLVKTSRPIIMSVRQRIQQNLSFQPQRFSLSPPQRPRVPQPQATNRVSTANFNRLPNQQRYLASNKLFRNGKIV
ncbi:hypothetical protein J6590_025892 [Homalodisca vitripennis]|nr:hypothetical protein J6590_025892 [Homalodisca vitripennis]